MLTTQPVSGFRLLRSRSLHRRSALGATGVLGLVISGGASAAVFDNQPDVVVNVEAWAPTATGHWRDTGASDAGEVNAADVGLDRRRISPVVSAEASLPFIEVFAGGFDYRSRGDGSEPYDVHFASPVFIAGTPIHVDARLEDLYAGAAFKPLDIPFYSLAIGLAGHAVRTSTTLNGSGQTGTLTKTTAIPAVVGQIEVGPFLGLSADVSLQWMTFDAAHIDRRLLDVEAGVNYSLIGPLAVRAGYKYLRVLVDDTRAPEQKADLRLTGPFAGVSLRF